MQYSRYQQAIFDWVRHGSGHLVVKATAGSGKTTTLLEIAARLPRDLEIRFLAFNRNVVKELRERLPPYVDTRTLHSLGFKALREHDPAVGSLEVAEYKYGNAVADVIDQMARKYPMSESEEGTARKYLTDLVRFAMLSLTDPADSDALRDLAEVHDLSAPRDRKVEKRCIRLVQRIVEQGTALPLTEKRPPSYEDMVYIPVQAELTIPGADFVLVDEAQDLSTAQLELACRAIRKGGRAIFVGDERQSIYGFAGADIDAIPRIIQRTNATVLPLSLSYRCPKSHVRPGQMPGPRDRMGARRHQGAHRLDRRHTFSTQSPWWRSRALSLQRPSRRALSGNDPAKKTRIHSGPEHGARAFRDRQTGTHSTIYHLRRSGGAPPDLCKGDAQTPGAPLSGRDYS